MGFAGIDGSSTTIAQGFVDCHSGIPSFVSTKSQLQALAHKIWAVYSNPILSSIDVIQGRALIHVSLSCRRNDVLSSENSSAVFWNSPEMVIQSSDVRRPLAIYEIRKSSTTSAYEMKQCRVKVNIARVEHCFPPFVDARFQSY